MINPQAFADISLWPMQESCRQPFGDSGLNNKFNQ